MAYGKWSLTTEEEKYFIPLFKYMIDELTCGRRDEFDLSGKGINPIQAQKLMKQLGYPIENIEANNCTQDFWQYFKGTNIYLYHSGMSFELKLEIEK